MFIAGEPTNPTTRTCDTDCQREILNQQDDFCLSAGQSNWESTLEPECRDGDTNDPGVRGFIMDGYQQVQEENDGYFWTWILNFGQRARNTCIQAAGARSGSNDTNQCIRRLISGSTAHRNRTIIRLPDISGLDRAGRLVSLEYAWGTAAAQLANLRTSPGEQEREVTVTDEARRAIPVPDASMATLRTLVGAAHADAAAAEYRRLFTQALMDVEDDADLLNSAHLSEIADTIIDPLEDSDSNTTGNQPITGQEAVDFLRRSNVDIVEKTNNIYVVTLYQVPDNVIQNATSGTFELLRDTYHGLYREYLEEGHVNQTLENTHGNARNVPLQPRRDQLATNLISGLQGQNTFTYLIENRPNLTVTPATAEGELPNVGAVTFVPVAGVRQTSGQIRTRYTQLLIDEAIAWDAENNPANSSRTPLIQASVRDQVGTGEYDGNDFTPNGMTTEQLIGARVVGVNPSTGAVTIEHAPDGFIQTFMSLVGYRRTQVSDGQGGDVPATDPLDAALARRAVPPHVADSSTYREGDNRSVADVLYYASRLYFQLADRALRETNRTTLTSAEQIVIGQAVFTRDLEPRLADTGAGRLLELDTLHLTSATFTRDASGHITGVTHEFSVQSGSGSGGGIGGEFNCVRAGDTNAQGECAINGEGYGGYAGTDLEGNPVGGAYLTGDIGMRWIIGNGDTRFITGLALEAAAFSLPAWMEPYGDSFSHISDGAYVVPFVLRQYNATLGVQFRRGTGTNTSTHELTLTGPAYLARPDQPGNFALRAHGFAGGAADNGMPSRPFGTRLHYGYAHGDWRANVNLDVTTTANSIAVNPAEGNTANIGQDDGSIYFGGNVSGVLPLHNNFQLELLGSGGLISGGARDGSYHLLGGLTYTVDLSRVDIRGGVRYTYLVENSERNPEGTPTHTVSTTHRADWTVWGNGEWDLVLTGMFHFFYANSQDTAGGGNFNFLSMNMDLDNYSGNSTDLELGRWLWAVTAGVTVSHRRWFLRVDGGPYGVEGLGTQPYVGVTTGLTGRPIANTSSGGNRPRTADPVRPVPSPREVAQQPATPAPRPVVQPAAPVQPAQPPAGAGNTHIAHFRREASEIGVALTELEGTRSAIEAMSTSGPQRTASLDRLTQRVTGLRERQNALLQYAGDNHISRNDLPRDLRDSFQALIGRLNALQEFIRRAQ